MIFGEVITDYYSYNCKRIELQEIRLILKGLFLYCKKNEKPEKSSKIGTLDLAREGVV